MSYIRPYTEEEREAHRIAILKAEGKYLFGDTPLPTLADEVVEKPLIEYAVAYQKEVNKLYLNIQSNMPLSTYTPNNPNPEGHSMYEPSDEHFCSTDPYSDKAKEEFVIYKKVKNGETAEPLILNRVKDKRESFYDIRANQFAKTEADKLPSFVYGTNTWDVEEEMLDYPNVSKRGKYMAIFLIVCGAVIGILAFIKGIPV